MNDHLRWVGFPLRICRQVFGDHFSVVRGGGRGTYLLVLVEVGAVGEGPGTVRAAEGPLARVLAQVLEQRPAFRERAAALAAAVRAAAALAPHVRRPRAAGHEPGSTCKPDQYPHNTSCPMETLSRVAASGTCGQKI